jgi:hypothetical protein
VDPVPDPLLLGKLGSAENRTKDLWISIQEHRPLDHRDGQITATVIRLKKNFIRRVLRNFEGIL